MSKHTSLMKDNKAKIVAKFGRSPQDTGAPEVQVALLTDHIKSLTEHLKAHKQDFSTQNGLLKAVGRRRRLLDFLKNSAPSRYLKLISDLELRK